MNCCGSRHHLHTVLRARRIAAERALRVRYRGMNTTIIFPARHDSWIVGGASRSYYAELLEAGLNIHE